MSCTEEEGLPEGKRATPGKSRTWWHPLLSSFLRWQLKESYQVLEEVPVGTKPLQIDILLLRKDQGTIGSTARKILAGLVEVLNEWTLIEFKSPSDTLRRGDFQTLIAYALLFRIQQQPSPPLDRLTLAVLAPNMTKSFRAELEEVNVAYREHQPGMWQLSGGLCLHPVWLLETEVLSGKDFPLLTLFSPRLLGRTTGNE